MAARRNRFPGAQLPLILILGSAFGLVGGCGSGATSADEQQIEVIVDRLNEYWSEVDGDVGFNYVPVADDRISTGDDGVTCDGDEIRAADVVDNAFVDANCEEGILVAYDPDYLAVGLARTEATLSHEWGHVVQAQAIELDLSLDPDGLPIDSELQADCFSGAWAAAESDSMPEALRADLAGAADPHDVEVDASDAHGTAGERIIAFDLGYRQGPVACVFELVDRLPG